MEIVLVRLQVDEYLQANNQAAEKTVQLKSAGNKFIDLN